MITLAHGHRGHAGQPGGDIQLTKVRVPPADQGAIEVADFERAQPLLKASLPLLQRLGTAAETAFCLSMLGLLAYRTGDYHVEKAHCQATIARYNTLGDTRGLATTGNSLGHVYADWGTMPQHGRCMKKVMPQPR